MAGMNEKKISDAREHLREAEKWYKVCFMLCYMCCSDYCIRQDKDNVETGRRPLASMPLK